MTIDQFNEYMLSGRRVEGSSDEHKLMHAVSEQARKITAELNSGYRSQEEIRSFMTLLTGKEVFYFIPSVLQRLRQKHYLGQRCFYQLGLLFSGSRRYRNRRRVIDRTTSSYSYAKSRAEPERQTEYVARKGRYRQKRMGGRACHNFTRGYRRRQQRHRRRSRGKQRRSGKQHSRRRTCKDY